jgi:hypothetical protein
MKLCTQVRAQPLVSCTPLATKMTVEASVFRTMPVQRAHVKSFALAGGGESSSSSTSESLDQQPAAAAAAPIASPSTRVLSTSPSAATTTQYRRQPAVETTSQHFGGALTTLVFGAVLLSERLNGIGIVQNLELHNKGFHPVLLGSILGLMCAAAWPEKNERLNPSKMVRMQMAFARIAYLGLAGAIAAEIYTGKGILTLMDFETGVEAISDVEAVLAFAAMLFLTGPQSRTLK